MDDLTIPPFLRISAEDRKRSWEESGEWRKRMLAQAAPAVTKETSEFLEELERKEAEKKANKLRKLKLKTYQSRRAVSDIPEKFRVWCTRTSRFVDARPRVAARREQALIELQSWKERNEMTLQQKIDQYNEIAAASGKPTRKWFANSAAAEAAIRDLQPQSKEDQPVTKTKPKRTSKMAAGQLPKGAKHFKQVRAGTTRARMLAEMAGGHSTPEEIARKLKTDVKSVMAHAYCTWRDCGIGYEMRGGRIKALFPTGVTLKSAVKEAQ